MHTLSILLSYLVPTAHAQSAWREYYGIFGGSGSGQGFIVDLAVRGANFFLLLVSGGAILAIMWSGIQMAMSGGNEEAKENAKKTIQYALIGAILAIMAQAIINFTAAFVSSLNV